MRFLFFHLRTAQRINNRVGFSIRSQDGAQGVIGMSKLFAVFLLSCFGLSAAVAHHHHDYDGGGWSFKAPEIDPSSAISGLALLIGGLMVVRARTVKQ